MARALAEQRKKEVSAKAATEKEHVEKERTRKQDTVEVEASASHHTKE